jgi:hypothetical protein
MKITNKKKVNRELVSAGTVSQFSFGILDIRAIQICHTTQIYKS